MSEIIEHRDGEPNTVRVGDSESSVSIKLYQDVYHQITGRTEEVGKRYSNNLLVDFSELEQLHYKIMQLFDIHHILAKNEVVTVYHDKERKEQFTSFDRFRFYNSSSSSPTISVVLKYNFSLRPAGLDRPQEYVVTIRFQSRAAIMSQLEREAPPFVHSRMIGYLNASTAEIRVEYSDYVVARGFIEAFDEWISGCNSNKDIAFLSFLRRYSHFLPRVGKAMAATLLIAVALHSIPALTADDRAGVWPRFFVVFFGGFYLLAGTTRVLFEYLENSIDSYAVLSYLKLNRGDDNLVNEFKRRNAGVVRRFVLTTIITVVLGIASSKIATLI